MPDHDPNPPPAPPAPADLVAAMPFAAAVGVEITRATPGEVTGELAWSPDRLTVGDAMHGGALLALADSLGAVCAFLNLPPGAATTTISSSANFFRAVRGGRARARSTPLHVGRTTVVVQTDVRDDAGRPVALVTQTQAVIAGDRAEPRPSATAAPAERSPMSTTTTSTTTESAGTLGQRPTRSETIAGLIAEYGRFADLVESLSPDGWARPSRCTGADVRDVAGHVIGLAEDVVAGKAGSRTFEEEAATVRDDPPDRAAARLRAAVDALGGLAAALDDDAAWDQPSGVGDLTVGQGVLLLWYDTYVHADDVRAAVGRPPEPGAGERAALWYLVDELARRGFGPARLELVDRSGVILEVGDAGDAPPRHRVPAHDFILAATGRRDPAPLGLDAGVNIYAG